MYIKAGATVHVFAKKFHVMLVLLYTYSQTYPAVTSIKQSPVLNGHIYLVLL